MSALLGQDQASLLVLFLENECLDRFGHRDNLEWISVVADAELPARDDTLRLVTNVEQDFVTVDLDHDAFDELTIFDGDHRRRIRLVEVCFGDVVLGDCSGDVVAFCVEGSKFSGCGV